VEVVAEQQVPNQWDGRWGTCVCTATASPLRCNLLFQEKMVHEVERSISLSHFTLNTDILAVDPLAGRL
jgi:hypothetical protein